MQEVTVLDDKGLAIKRGSSINKVLLTFGLEKTIPNIVYREIKAISSDDKLPLDEKIDRISKNFGDSVEKILTIKSLLDKLDKD